MEPLEQKKEKKEEKVKDIELPNPPKPFEPDGIIHKVDPIKPFKPTDKQIQEVFQNRLDQELPIQDDMFTGFLGLNSQAYIIYYIMEQQKKIDALIQHVTVLTKQINILTQNRNA
jgi:hypothetical protein